MTPTSVGRRCMEQASSARPSSVMEARLLCCPQLLLTSAHTLQLLHCSAAQLLTHCNCPSAATAPLLLLLTSSHSLLCRAHYCHSLLLLPLAVASATHCCYCCYCHLLLLLIDVSHCCPLSLRQLRSHSNLHRMSHSFRCVPS